MTKKIFLLFYFIYKFKVIAVPHTTGSETYSKGFYKNKILRRKKHSCFNKKQ